jgi:hypothetical protein
VSFFLVLCCLMERDEKTHEQTDHSVVYNPVRADVFRRTSRQKCMRILVHFAFSVFLKSKKEIQGLIKSKSWGCSLHLSHPFQGFINDSEYYRGSTLIFSLSETILPRRESTSAGISRDKFCSLAKIRERLSMTYVRVLAGDTDRGGRELSLLTTKHVRDSSPRRSDN